MLLSLKQRGRHMIGWQRPEALCSRDGDDSCFAICRGAPCFQGYGVSAYLPVVSISSLTFSPSSRFFADVKKRSSCRTTDWHLAGMYLPHRCRCVAPASSAPSHSHFPRTTPSNIVFIFCFMKVTVGILDRLGRLGDYKMAEREEDTAQVRVFLRRALGEG